MNKFRLILAMVLSVLWGGAAELDYQIGENGRLTVTLDGAVLFGDEELLLMDAVGLDISLSELIPIVSDIDPEKMWMSQNKKGGKK